MKKSSLILLAATLISVQAFSHSGRTDSSGGHSCSYKSQQKGLCSGYHYHGGLKVDEKGVATQVEPKISKTAPKTKSPAANSDLPTT